MLSRTLDVNELALPSELVRRIRGKATCAEPRFYSACDPEWYPGDPEDTRSQFGLMPKVGVPLQVNLLQEVKLTLMAK